MKVLSPLVLPKAPQGASRKQTQDSSFCAALPYNRECATPPRFFNLLFFKEVFI
jgi:hypothetical protein